ncbi:hypothetical protein DB30_01438 [Enhygromyxa salina]|uniref:Uncharacterized protein n=1 Tax=Enhygromyxa salina TaxID=215803 RepID=A0A0C1ZLB7_9BACT|nr:hypothetical protein DB30_01438 [Enhygromyxa salina]
MSQGLLPARPTFSRLCGVSARVSFLAAANACWLVCTERGQICRGQGVTSSRDAVWRRLRSDGQR